MKTTTSWTNLGLLGTFFLMPAAHGADASSVTVNGYARAGIAWPNRDSSQEMTLGGDAQKFRLGNEFSQGIEINVRATRELGQGMQLRAHWTPSVWDGKYSNDEGYISLDKTAGTQWWIGQRRCRIFGVYIVDQYLVNYGDNIGLGMSNKPLPFGTMAISLFTSKRLGPNGSPSGAGHRLNLDVSDMRDPWGGQWRAVVTAATGPSSAPGLSLSVLHQKDMRFGSHRVERAELLQWGKGYAGLTGQFDMSNQQAATSTVRWRMAQVLTWQTEGVGMQFIAALSKHTDTTAELVKHDAREVAVGGRLSYALDQHVKLLLEASTTSRHTPGQPMQRLSKLTVAPAWASDRDWLSRPEWRLYLSRVVCNEAAWRAHEQHCTTDQSRTGNVVGIQLETWW